MKIQEILKQPEGKTLELLVPHPAVLEYTRADVPVRDRKSVV